MINFSKLKNKFSPQIILVLSFFTAILIGAILLTTDFASAENPIGIIDALFTSASATCVTGLVVVDTGTQFNTIGQTIILILIQIGGLGVMSFSTLFLFYFRGKLGIGSREIIQETLSSDSSEVNKLLKSVFVYTFVIELIGAVLLFVRFIETMPLSEAIYTSIFHSISAFCNAGFSTFSDSLVRYQDDLFVNMVFMALIILGGLGFIVLHELGKFRKTKFSWYKLSIHSKIVLLTSLILIISGTVFIYTFDYNNAFKNNSIFGGLLTSLFQSVTARTAGFNSVEMTNLSMQSLVILTILMFIGASPASCGGGIKTVTLAVLFAYVRAKLNDKKNTNIFYRTLPSKLVSKAIIIFSFSIFTVIFFSVMLSFTEIPHVPFHETGVFFNKVVFEVVSAFGTVGLSTGITSQFSAIGKLMLTLLMFIGRLGPVTIAYALGAKKTIDIKYANDNVIVG